MAITNCAVTTRRRLPRSATDAWRAFGFGLLESFRRRFAPRADTGTHTRTYTHGCVHTVPDALAAVFSINQLLVNALSQQQQDDASKAGISKVTADDIQAYTHIRIPIWLE